MDVEKHRIWQVAAGDVNRNYADLCLEWDVILNSPGEDRPWPDCRAALTIDCSQRKVTDIKRFAEDITDGDIILLRVGTSAVYGVGIVVGNYEWNEEFGDIDGWELQHLRRVRWIWKFNTNDQKVPPKPKQFTKYTLNFGDTTQEIIPPNDVIIRLKVFL